MTLKLTLEFSAFLCKCLLILPHMKAPVPSEVHPLILWKVFKAPRVSRVRRRVHGSEAPDSISILFRRRSGLGRAAPARERGELLFLRNSSGVRFTHFSSFIERCQKAPQIPVCLPVRRSAVCCDVKESRHAAVDGGVARAGASERPDSAPPLVAAHPLIRSAALCIHAQLSVEARGGGCIIACIYSAADSALPFRVHNGNASI